MTAKIASVVIICNLSVLVNVHRHHSFRLICERRRKIFTPFAKKLKEQPPPFWCTLDNACYIAVFYMPQKNKKVNDLFCKSIGKKAFLSLLPLIFIILKLHCGRICNVVKSLYLRGTLAADLLHSVDLLVIVLIEVALFKLLLIHTVSGKRKDDIHGKILSVLLDYNDIALALKQELNCLNAHT